MHYFLFLPALKQQGETTSRVRGKHLVLFGNLFLGLTQRFQVLLKKKRQSQVFITLYLPVIYSISRYLLNAYCMLSIATGAGATRGKKTLHLGPSGQLSTKRWLCSCSQAAPFPKDLPGTENNSALGSLGPSPLGPWGTSLQHLHGIMDLHSYLPAGCFPLPYGHAPISLMMPNHPVAIYLSLFTVRLPERLIYSHCL